MFGENSKSIFPIAHGYITKYTAMSPSTLLSYLSSSSVTGDSSSHRNGVPENPTYDPISYRAASLVLGYLTIILIIIVQGRAGYQMIDNQRSIELV